MPIFIYICTKCNTKQERLYRGDPIKCEHCGGDLKKLLSFDGISVQYKANGFTKQVRGNK